MKHKNYLLAAVLFILCAAFISSCGKKDAGAPGSENKDAKDVSITETTPFHIKYEMKGDESGTLEIFSNGKNVKLVMSAKQAGTDIKSDIYKTEDGVIMVSDVLGKKTGLKMKLEDKDAKQFKEILNAKEMLKDYKKAGTESVLGYKCDIYTNDTSKIYMYKDIVALKFEYKSKSGTIETMTATAFEPDAKLADDLFVVPKDIEIMDMDNLMKDMKSLEKIKK